MMLPLFLLHHHGSRYVPKCRHCGGADPLRSDSAIADWFLDHPAITVPGILIGLIWLIVTVMTWAASFEANPPTLLQVLRDQAHWLWALLHRIA